MRYATTELAAQSRYDTYRSVDPFPDIQPALLNSADIRDYVDATGMIVPFEDSDEVLKPASYGIRLRGRCIYWDANGARQDFVLSDQALPAYPNLEHRAEIILERNSIAFVTLEPTIRLPSYIALRFNLAIREVYRGLLLGTGPLVDPGFQGKLSFPLHNLTDQTYRIKAREQLVWVEFTKISMTVGWLTNYTREALPTRHGTVAPFPPRKLARKDIQDYLVHANNWAPVRSSIPVEIRAASKAAREAGETVAIFRRASLWGAIALAVGLFALAWAGIQYGTDAVSFLNDSRKELNDAKETLKSTNQALKEVRDKVDTANLAGLQQELAGLDSQFKELQSQNNPTTLKALQQRVGNLDTEVKALQRQLQSRSP